MRDEVKDKNLKLQIKLDDETSKGMYVNLALVNHTQGEFTIDAMYVQPQQPLANVRARLISSPHHTKRLLRALQPAYGPIGNLGKYCCSARFSCASAC